MSLSSSLISPDAVVGGAVFVAEFLGVNHEQIAVGSLDGDDLEGNAIPVVSKKHESFIVVVWVMVRWRLRQDEPAVIDDVRRSVVRDVVLAGRPGESHPYILSDNRLAVNG
jgi:hypothetical protein